jgi:D-alanyl-D-alanine carboxypeptidase (penicillin-binding protein 5/6)
VLTSSRAALAGLVISVVAVTSAAPAVAVTASVASVTLPTAPRAGTPVGGPALGTAGVVVHYLPGATPYPATADAQSWLIADLDTGEVLAAKAPHRRTRPASTLKTLTSITLMPQLDKSAIHTVTHAEAAAEGSRVGLVTGATYSVWDLWNALLLPSANDAAAALADHNGGFPRTVSQMQAKARSLQAYDTTVKNPSGLDADGQFTSAYDMALFAREAMRLADFRTVTGTIRYDFPGHRVAAGVARPTYKIYSENRLLLHGYKGTVGGKTGYTSLAHRTYWGAVTRGGHTLVITMFQVTGPTEPAAKSLLSWAFRNYGKLAPVGTLVDPAAASPASTSPSAVPTPDSSTTTLSAGAGSALSALAAGTAKSLPWVLLAVLIGVGGVLVLVLARRRDHDDDPPAAPDTTAAPATAPSPRPAAARSSSVVVTTPGRPTPPAPERSHVTVSPARATPTAAGPTEPTVTGTSSTSGDEPDVFSTQPITVAPASASADTPRAGAIVPDETAKRVEVEVTKDSAADEPEDRPSALVDDSDDSTGAAAPTTSPAPARPAPGQGGHVRVITPPTRPPA